MSLRSDIELLGRVITLAERILGESIPLDADRAVLLLTEEVAAARHARATMKVVGDPAALLVHVLARLFWARSDRNEELTALYRSLAEALKTHVASDQVAALKSESEIR